MKKNIIGIFSLLVVIFIITAIINPKFLNAYNMQNLIKWSSLYAVMSIGVAIVIITGGIDLSIGSVVGLVAVVLAFCLKIPRSGSMVVDRVNLGSFIINRVGTWSFGHKSGYTTVCGHAMRTFSLQKSWPLVDG